MLSIEKIDKKIEKLSSKLAEVRDNKVVNEEKEIRLLKKIKKLSDLKKEELQKIEQSSISDTNLTA